MDHFDFAQAADNALVLGSVLGFFITFTCGFLVVALGGRS